MGSRIYLAKDVTHDGAILRVDGVDYMIAAVELMEGEPGCEPEAVAYLTPLEDQPDA
jgi:hypothetical protein